jgi:hypothetical protein
MSDKKVRVVFLSVSILIILTTLIVNAFLYHRYAYYALTHKWMILTSIMGLLLFWSLIFSFFEARFLRGHWNVIIQKIQRAIFFIILFTVVVLSTRGIQLAGIYLNERLTEYKLQGETQITVAQVDVIKRFSGFTKKRERKLIVSSYMVNGKLYKLLLPKNGIQHAGRKEIIYNSRQPVYAKLK